MKILIAEDDNNLRYALQTIFQRNHFTVDAVDNGEDALDFLRLYRYDAAILDIMMPKKDGITILKQLRIENNATPILLLTANSEIEDRVLGLDAGANDYLPKPFDIRELLARMRVLTRSPEQQSSKLFVGNVCLDTASITVSGPNGMQNLVNKEYQTLLLLAQNFEKPISADRILQAAWEPDSVGRENALWTVIYNLRQKLTSIGADITIRNKRNLGYVLEIRK